MKIHNTILLFLLALILSCHSATRYSDKSPESDINIALNGDHDESGIGGTGKQLANGVGGTGKPASGVGGTGKQLANGVGGTGKPASGVGGTGKQLANGVGGTGKPASGIGGTGKQLANGVGGTGKPASGVGGTGQIANSGLGGTGIVGEITGFGSIYVNGLEIEILTDSEIRFNNRTNAQGKTQIGDIVEILAHRKDDDIIAKKINIRYEVVGPVESLNLKNHSFTIIGQVIKLDDYSVKLPQLGEMIAVSGFRDRLNVIHVTRLSRTNSNSVWLIDEITAIKSGLIKFKNTSIQTEHANFYHQGDTIRVRANFKNGQLYATEIYNNSPFGNQVRHMILQGFIIKGNRNNYRIGDVQFSSRHVRIRASLDRRHGNWTRIEVRRNRVGLWEVDTIIDDQLIKHGRTTTQQTQPNITIPSHSSSRSKNPPGKSSLVPGSGNKQNPQDLEEPGFGLPSQPHPGAGIPTPGNPNIPSIPNPSMPGGGNPGGGGMPGGGNPGSGGMPGGGNSGGGGMPGGGNPGGGGMPGGGNPSGGGGMPGGGNPGGGGMPGGGNPSGGGGMPGGGNSGGGLPGGGNPGGGGGMPGGGNSGGGRMPGGGYPNLPGSENNGNSPNANNDQNSSSRPSENNNGGMGGRMR